MTTTTPAMEPTAAAAPRPVRGGPTDPSHDAELRRGIIHTHVRRGLAVGMIVFFLGIFWAVPLVQAVMERIKDDESVLPDLFKRAPTKDNIRQFEEDLEKASYVHDWVQPRLQAVLTRLGFGNRKAVVGRGGWLYYKPGVLAVAGPGFLDPDILAMRRKAALDEGELAVDADPRPAVLKFQRALAARGIRLVLVPLPDKASLQPTELHGRSSAGSSDRPQAVALNPDFARFVAEMRAAGVIVFDPAPLLLLPGQAPRFLIQDTHWTPAWMEAVAAELAAAVKKEVDLTAPATAPGWKVSARDIERVGDIVDMLKLPEGQRLFVPQKVTVHQVQNADGTPWQPSEAGDVLLLGDSFTNIFSQAPMGWGEGAGLAPHLALSLGRPIDVIAQNNDGSFATRKLLAEALSAGEDRLAGKKVVVWELASRELAVGNWKGMSYEVGATR